MLTCQLEINVNPKILPHVTRRKKKTTTTKTEDNNNGQAKQNKGDKVYVNTKQQNICKNLSGNNF